MISHMRVARESVLVQIGGVVIFAAVIAALWNLTRIQLGGTALIAAGVVLAIVPAALWLWMFYRQDRIEPEPRQFVIGVFVLGALLAYAVGQPVLRNLFSIQDWLDANVVVSVLGSILVVGLVQQFLLYAAVRYSVFNSTEFDERIDGIIYGAAAGLGYATMSNIQYVVGNNGVDLGIGAMRVAVEALSLASLGAISGYFLARAKFDKMGPLWLPIGMAIAATLDGLVDFALDRVPTLGSGLGFNAWYGLVAAVVIAGATFAVLFQLIQRLNLAAATHVSQSQKSALDGVLVGEGQSEEPEWIVWVVVVAGLAIGWLMASFILGETKTATMGNVSVTYPAAWSRTTETGAAFSAYDLNRGGIYGTRVSVYQKAKAEVLPPRSSISDAAANWALSRQKQLQGYHLLGIESTQVQGREAAQVSFVYLLDPPQGSTSGTIPALMRGVETLVVSGDNVYVLSFAAQTQDFDSLDGLRSQLMAGWRVP